MDRAERIRRTENIIKKRKQKLKDICGNTYYNGSDERCKSPLEDGVICEGQLRNNNEMNRFGQHGTAKKTKAKHGHASYRHKGDYGPAIDYAPKDQRQVDDMKDQLDKLNEKD